MSKKTTTISLDKDVYYALNNAAKSERRTMSSFLNSLLAAILIEGKERLKD